MSRINVYHHEIPFMAARHEVVTKVAEGITYYGIRFYTEAPLEHMPGDDDSAAITLWVPYTRRGGTNTDGLREIARAIVDYCAEIENET